MENFDNLYLQVKSTLDRLSQQTEGKEPLTQIQDLLQMQYFRAKVEPLLSKLYYKNDPKALEKLIAQIYSLINEQYQFAPSIQEDLHKWNEQNILLITYGDSILFHNDSPSFNYQEKPLVTLAKFLEKYLSETITGVHILPFFPFTSDDGFAVQNYLKVNPELGDWNDVESLGKSFDLMFDLVINHLSSEHEWFKQFKNNEKPGKDYFIECHPNEDVSQVTRPRTSPLLTKISTKQGDKYVWTTFSEDQIDVNFANPDVLIEFINILLFYVKKGAKYIRLDAIGYLWKTLGTSCIHLPETYIVVQLLREILQMANPSVTLITETNVPNKENLSYFGDHNEAHMIYNFSLPPLLLNALFRGESQHFETWLKNMPPAPQGCAYFNFIASHDGIGLRPTEGLLDEEEFNILLEKMQEFGGKISYKNNADGNPSPYELNIALFDAMKGTFHGEDEWQNERFLCAHTIKMSLEGIPGFYIHSFLATPNDYAKFQKDHQNRSLNRHQWDYQKLDSLLKNSNSAQWKILNGLSRLIKIRRQQSAFHPNATQYTLPSNNGAILIFWRHSINREQSIFCVNNLSRESQEMDLSQLNLSDIQQWYDLINPDQNHAKITDIKATIPLQPYQCLWISNK